MNIFEFGDAKLRCRDIDPLYFALVKLSLRQRRLFTMSLVMFDHAGLAAQITESSDFYKAMHAARGGYCAWRAKTLCTWR